MRMPLANLGWKSKYSVFHPLSCGLSRVQALTLKVSQKKGLFSSFSSHVLHSISQQFLFVCLGGHPVCLSALFFIQGSNSEPANKTKATLLTFFIFICIEQKTPQPFADIFDDHKGILRGPEEEEDQP